MSWFPASLPKSVLKPKIFVFSEALPEKFIDPGQPPTKHSPWRQIRELPLVRTVTLIMPEEIYQSVYKSCITTTDGDDSTGGSSNNRALPRPRYGRVTLTLTDILTDTNGPWWTNTQLVMLSEGRSGVDHARFEIREGSLRMELSRETYEKCGLQGQPLGASSYSGGGGGRKHLKAWYEVRVGLLGNHQPKGRRGMERVLWAAKNVLDLIKGPLTWLVVDEGDGKDHAATTRGFFGTTAWTEVVGAARLLHGVRVPEKVRFYAGEEQQHEQEDWYEVVEWLDMVALDSDGFGGQDNSYLCQDKAPSGQTADLRVVKWSGLLSWRWILALIIKVNKRSREAHVETSGSWLSLSVTGHRTDAVRPIDGYTVVLQSGNEEGGTSKGFQRSRCFQFINS